MKSKLKKKSTVSDTVCPSDLDRKVDIDKQGN